MSATLGLATIAAMLGGCTDYGYGGISAGYGAGGYYDDAYGPGLGGGFGYPGYGWYDDFYYPGTGFYVYDRGGGRHRWNDRQRSHWEGRHGGGGPGAGVPGRPDRPGGFGRPGWGARPGNGGRPGGTARPGDGRGGITAFPAIGPNGGPRPQGGPGMQGGSPRPPQGIRGPGPGGRDFRGAADRGGGRGRHGR